MRRAGDVASACRVGAGGVLAAVVLAATSAVLVTASARAAATPRAVTVVKNVTYERIDGTKVPLSIFVPGGSGPFPALVFIHGGAFVTGDKCQLRTAAQAHHLASAGFVVYNIDYRLAAGLSGFPTRLRCADGTTADVTHLQGNSFPAGADDAAAAVRWIRDNGARYKTDTTHISCVGSSAGGTLCYGLGAEGLVDAQVGWSGPTKLDEPFARSVTRNYVGCPVPTRASGTTRNIAWIAGIWVLVDLVLGAIWLVAKRRRGPSASSDFA